MGDESLVLAVGGKAVQQVESVRDPKQDADWLRVPSECCIDQRSCSLVHTEHMRAAARPARNLVPSHAVDYGAL
ncbi:hypothetical protein IF2G_01400 [Cordyceps javanica]|nr:hypothetical protein IF2G_01400 [Cordyceps javanica]